MDFKTLNEKLDKILEKREPSYKLSINMEDFVTFCQNKGYKVTPSKRFYDPHYLININGYTVLFSTGGSGITFPKDTPKDAFYHSKIDFDSPNFTGYMRTTKLGVEDFDSNEEYFEYALQQMIEFANYKIEKINVNKETKQILQNNIQALKDTKSISGTKQQLMDVLKKIDLDDNSQFVLSLK